MFTENRACKNRVIPQVCPHKTPIAGICGNQIHTEFAPANRMFTYQVRPRVFRLEEGQALPFPADGEVRFYFSPLQPFGVEAGSGHTAVQNIAASVLFNANTGAHSVESKQPLAPLDVTIEEPARVVRTIGNVLAISQLFESNQQLTEIIESIYFVFPMLLAVEFADPPIIERVDGQIGKVKFRWELKSWRARFEITTQDKQELSVASSWERISVLSNPLRRRLLAALHYYHVALRLARRGEIAGEFLPEMILNLSKVLEVLFPSSGDGKTRDAARAGLRALGFSETEIEADYIPAMALRNEIDVGHVDLSLLKVGQLSIIHGYAEYAETAFRLLLKRVLDKIISASFEVEPYEPTSAIGDAAKIVERLRGNAERYGR
ncbi:MAG: hypothetical protein ABIP48_07675 [Planctomycetota bacterium]